MRVTHAKQQDWLEQVVEASAGDQPFALPANSMVQLELVASTDIPLLGSVVDVSQTPGSLAQLARWETLRLEARDEEGQPINQGLRWTSSHPELVHVSQGGLVQRRRDAPVPITITVEQVWTQRKQVLTLG